MSNGLFVCTNLNKLQKSLTSVNRLVDKYLFIHLHPNTHHDLQLKTIYATSTQSCPTQDVRVLLTNLKASSQFSKLTKPIDVLLLDCVLSVAETNKFVENYVTSNISRLEACELEPCGVQGPPPAVQMYDSVVLGGTFDRLHVGHKILLSEAVLRAKKRVVVGVTDTNMTKSKKLPELILPVNQRIQEVTDFLNDVDSTLHYEVVPIQDPFGPTATDPDMDLIVVSSETLRGGEKVNELREKNRLKKLDIHSIDLVEFKPTSEVQETKVSSSNKRMDMLGTRLRLPDARPHLPNDPYIIGLMGGIASGKSSMGERFEKLGATVIDCDKLAHQLYEPGEDCYNALKDYFGDTIVGSDGRIDRKALGGIVFADKEKLTALNNLVWPAIQKRVKAMIADIAATKRCQVIIMEAAILLQAGWQKECHEVWSCIIPADEAVKRIVARNGLSETEAKQRIDSQIDNSTIVANSNIVFSSLWSYEYSQEQAERAWSMLTRELKEKWMKSTKL